jgi:hypothetical protein
MSAPLVGFPGWQDSEVGKGEVRRAVRSTLLRYKLHHDQDLFERGEFDYVDQTDLIGVVVEPEGFFKKPVVLPRRFLRRATISCAVSRPD